MVYTGVWRRLCERTMPEPEGVPEASRRAGRRSGQGPGAGPKKRGYGRSGAAEFLIRLVQFGGLGVGVALPTP